MNNQPPTHQTQPEIDNDGEISLPDDMHNFDELEELES